MKTLLKNAFTVSGLLLLLACDFSVSLNSGNKTRDNLETVYRSTEKIRNHIGFEESGGLKVDAAFLMLEDGSLVPDDNVIKAGKRFKLILKLSGWETQNGMVQVGAGERLLNSSKVVMIQEDDLFAGADSISEEDAGVITLVMDVLNIKQLADFYQTDFKVWNKNAAQFVRGSYQFRLKK